MTIKACRHHTSAASTGCRNPKIRAIFFKLLAKTTRPRARLSDILGATPLPLLPIGVAGWRVPKAYGGTGFEPHPLLRLRQSVFKNASSWQKPHAGTAMVERVKRHRSSGNLTRSDKDDLVGTRFAVYQNRPCSTESDTRYSPVGAGMLLRGIQHGTT
jgi:hypothetical protein